MKEKIGLFVFIATLCLIPILTEESFAQEYPQLGVKIETVAKNLTIPWSIDWTPDGTIFFTERDGNLRVIQNGKLQENPSLSLEVGGIEGGLLGVTVDPNYSENNYIYLYYTYNELISTSNKVVRYQVAEDKKTVTEDKIIVEGIPGGPFHDGGRIQFGPDGKLYITTGEAGNPGLSQDINSLGGKILRINSDGTIPEDNPFDNSIIYSYGHRNPQGIDWDKSGNLLATEHGPSGIRGSAHDEINLIIPGTNYGWPDIIGDETKENMQTPILHSDNDTWAPSGAEFYNGDKIPQWIGKYFVATLRGSHLHMIDFDSENKKIISHEKLFQDEFGRIRDVVTGPDGFLYILTSNQDGRGTPKIDDDKILRIVPLDNIINNFKDTFVTNTKIELEPNNGFWQTYFQYGDVINGKVHFISENIEPEKANLGIAHIEMITPSGDKITVARNIPIIDNYAEFTIPVTDDKQYDLGKYILRANYNIDDNYYFGNYQEIFYIGQEQRFQYSGQGGPLDVNMQYVEYDISPIRFDIDEKSISFDFKKNTGEFAPDENWQHQNDIGLLIQRPLISPPYMIIIETEDNMIQYEPNDYEIKITKDNFYKYVLSLDEEWQKGTITIIGTYVIPEFGQITFIILAVGIIAMIVLSAKFSTTIQTLR